MSEVKEPRNWFFTLLVPASVVFVATALAVAFLPSLEDMARQAGNPPAPSAFREAVRSDGWWWLLVEMGVVVVLALAAMVWDQFRPSK